MKIMVFLQGTITMHGHGAGHTREEVVAQSARHENGVYEYDSYVPIGNAVKKLRTWAKQGAEILYMSSNENEENIGQDKAVLRRFGFPKGRMLFSRKGESYKEVTEKIMPDILIEDDCESIGGEKEMIYPNLSSEGKGKIKSIVVREFEGIDQLPDEIKSLGVL